jgi:transposase
VPRVDDRRVLNGIFWVLRSGAPWRDLPDRYGPRTTCYNRFVRWRRSGVLDRQMDATTVACDGNAIRDLIESQGAVPNIPAKSNRKWKPRFSKTIYRERNQVERFSASSSTCAESPPATTSSPTTSSPWSNSPQCDCGRALMSLPSNSRATSCRWQYDDPMNRIRS